MERIVNIIKMDLISILSKNGGKLKSIVMTVILSIFICLLGMFAMPDFLSYYLIIVGIVIVQMIIGQEAKSEAEKMLCVIPTDRKSIVIARFLLAFSAYTIVGIILFILIRISALLGFASDSITIEVVRIFLYYMNLPTTSIDTIVNIIFMICYMTGLIIMSVQLHGYFRNGAVNKSNSLIKKFLKLLLICLIVYAVIFVIGLLTILPFTSTAVLTLFQITMLLAIPAKGLILCSMMFVIGSGIMIYKIICSVIDYENREL